MISDALSTALVASATSIVLAIIAAPAGRRAVARAKNRRQAEVEEHGEEQQKSIDHFTSDPNGWAGEMFRQTKLAMERAERAEAKADRIERKFDEREREHRKFRSAVVRWLIRIRNLFIAHDIEMPYPADEDVETLAEVIPLLLEATHPRRPGAKPKRVEEDFG